MKTVGSILKKAREEKELDHKTVYSDTKIHPRYLAALEEGDWAVFASAVHAKGFLKNYAEYLELNVDEVLAFFRREFKDLKDKPTTKPFIPSLSRPRALITPTLAVGLITSVFVLLFLGYIFWEYRSFAGAPVLVIDQPTPNLTTHDPQLTVYGQTDPDATLKLNGQEINVDNRGSFSQAITLSPGANALTFSASNDLGRTHDERVVVILEESQAQTTGPGTVAATASAQLQPTENSKVSVRVEAKPNSIWLRVTSDEKMVFEGTIPANESREYSADRSLIIRTGNGGSTRVAVNGKDEGLIGKEGQITEKEYKR